MLKSRMTCMMSQQAENPDSTMQCPDVKARLLDASVSPLPSASPCVIPLSVCLQVCACIRTAMDAAQGAAAARDKLLDQQAESEVELRALRAKTTRQAAAVAAAADAEERVTAAQAKCKAAHADTSSWQSQVELLLRSDLARGFPPLPCLIPKKGRALYTNLKTTSTVI